MQKLSKERLATGKPGELATKVYLENNKSIKSFEDLTEDKDSWWADVDFLAERIDDERYYIEAKTIQKGNDCLRIELKFYKNQRAYDGWTIRSRAKILTVYRTDTNILYVFDFSKFKAFVATLPESEIGTYPDKDDEDKTYDLIFMPISKLERIVKEKYKIILPKEKWKATKETKYK